MAMSTVRRFRIRLGAASMLLRNREGDARKEAELAQTEMIVGSLRQEKLDESAKLSCQYIVLQQQVGVWSQGALDTLLVAVADAAKPRRRPSQQFCPMVANFVLYAVGGKNISEPDKKWINSLLLVASFKDAARFPSSTKHAWFESYKKEHKKRFRDVEPEQYFEFLPSPAQIRADHPMI